MQMATSPSGKAEVCKISISGSNPLVAYEMFFARVVELVDTQDLKSCGLNICTGSIPVSGNLFYTNNNTYLKMFFYQKKYKSQFFYLFKKYNIL